MNEAEEEITFVEPVYAPWDGRRVPVVLLGGYPVSYTHLTLPTKA